MKKFFKIFYQIIIHSLAVIALFFIGLAVASKFNLTNNNGLKDLNSRYFSSISNKNHNEWTQKNLDTNIQTRLLFNYLSTTYDFYPVDATNIYEQYYKAKDIETSFRMLEALKIKMKNNKAFIQALEKQTERKSYEKSIYDWSNYQVWDDFCKNVIKDKKAIDSASAITGVESRLIVTCLVGEQVRMFNSKRELFKQYVMPFSYMIMPKNLSFGVTGMKESCARQIEWHLRDKNSPYYLGEKHENLFASNDSTLRMQYDSLGNERSIQVRRLLQGGNHFYSYLYTALFIKQVCAQWKKAGHDISKRPEIIATIYNLGFKKSIPKKNPETGGSNFKIAEKEYTFGGLCFEFYYSGQIIDSFPIKKHPVLFDDWEFN